MGVRDIIVGGVRSWLDDIVTPACTAGMAVPAWYGEGLPLWMNCAFGALIAYRCLESIAAHQYIARDAERGEWHPEMLGTYLRHLNAHHYARRHPEHLDAYRALVRSGRGQYP